LIKIEDRISAAPNISSAEVSICCSEAPPLALCSIFKVVLGNEAGYGARLPRIIFIHSADEPEYFCSVAEPKESARKQ
jgi:hypothetical protein